MHMLSLLHKLCVHVIVWVHIIYSACLSIMSTLAVTTVLFCLTECQEGYYKLYDTYLPIGPGPNPSLEGNVMSSVMHIAPKATSLLDVYTTVSQCVKHNCDAPSLL